MKNTKILQNSGKIIIIILIVRTGDEKSNKLDENIRCR